MKQIKMTRESFYDTTKQVGECVIWTGRIGSHGYGYFYSCGKTVLAHRYAYELAKGPHKGLVLHSCNNRLCVNPFHLRSGTAKDNYEDMLKAGRQNFKGPKGSSNSHATLTEANVLDIRLRWKTEGSSALAREFGVNRSTILRAVKGIYWKSI